MDNFTQALHMHVIPDGVGATVTPLYQTSAFNAESPYFYTRKDNPNIREFELVVATLENAQHGIAVSSGMASISCTLELIKPTACIVVNRHIYGCTAKFFERLAERENSNILFLDLSIQDNINKIPPEASMIFFETPTNPFLKTIPIRRVVERAKSLNPDCLVVVDNTWATPLNQHPLELGADISLHSATKFMSGHSDVMGGIILCNDSFLAEKLKANRFYGGAILSPHSAWLLRRSLQTLDLRMNAHIKVTHEMTQWLKARPEIKTIYYPQIQNGQLHNYGGIIFFQFKDKYINAYTTFRDSLQLFDTGTGMAAVTSMVAQPFTGSHASLDEEAKKNMGLNKGLIRLCFGLETTSFLKEDLEQAFNEVSKHYR